MVNQAALWKLRLTMAGTVALIVAVTTLAFAAIMWWFEILDVTSLILLVAGFNLIQWLIAPYIVNAMYGVKAMSSAENPDLNSMVQNLAQRSGISKPKLMLSKLQIPNAFAYGSPLTGNMVAVTQGLLTTLEPEEVEAVIGHELGHLKHRDVQVMMVVSLLPSIFYILAQNLMWSGMVGGGGNRKNNGSGLALVGGLSMAVYFLLTLLNLGLSRQREYLADQHSLSVVEEGGRKLSEGLAKITAGTWKQQAYGNKTQSGGFKSLFIADPDRAAQDTAALHSARFGGASDSELVNQILGRRISGADNLLELFSTHPNIVKRLRALQQ